MGFNKLKVRIRSQITEWQCVGYFGYGHGRGVAEFGESNLRGKSVCMDVCKKQEECRRRHHLRMDSRYPQLNAIVAHAAKVATLNNRDLNGEIVEAMERAAELEVSEALEVKKINAQFGVGSMTDHYRCGQFQNIQNGLEKLAPNSRREVS